MGTWYSWAGPASHRPAIGCRDPVTALVAQTHLQGSSLRTLELLLSWLGVGLEARLLWQPLLGSGENTSDMMFPYFLKEGDRPS